MADLKTHLRELSVATTVGMLSSKARDFSQEELLNGSDFFNLASSVISSDIHTAMDIKDKKQFTKNEQEIINNGFKLGKAIIDNPQIRIKKNPNIIWTGNNTQSGNPIDLIIDDNYFSLKEDSYILNNGGLYQVLNALIGSSYKIGEVHVFNFYAKQEYDDWFKYTWDSFVSYLLNNTQWCLKTDRYKSRASIVDEKILMESKDKKSLIPKNICTNADFMKYTLVETREHVFAKWINSELSRNCKYIELKKYCSEVAGKKLSRIINEGFNSNDGMCKFLRIYDKQYYYAKTTSKEITMLLVPSKKDFLSVIDFIGCKHKVPKNQLNLIITLKNRKTQKEINFRIECRFSHGQFNGTPEAKLYVNKNSQLSEIYTQI